MKIFIGHDPREARATAACVTSIVANSTSPLHHLAVLYQEQLRGSGLYWRPWYRDMDGLPRDMMDGQPFSTEFTFTRFLVPALCGYASAWPAPASWLPPADPSPWALFCDCDFLFLADPHELLRHADTSKAVLVVKHDHRPREVRKMDGVVQTTYPRKNWSSLVLWNVAHPANALLTPHVVNTAPGRYLHGFGWLEDHLIGELPHEWNVLVGYDSPDTYLGAKALHYTLGTPDMPGRAATAMADLWWEYANGPVRPAGVLR